MNGALTTKRRDAGDILHPEPAPSRSERLSSTFMHPADVASDPRLTVEERRATLADWASDVRAVPNVPSLRQLDNGAIVRIDDILQALSSLDSGMGAGGISAAASNSAPPRRARLASRLKFALRRSRSDDDDEPPPCPAIVMRPTPGPFTGGGQVEPDVVLAA